MATNSVNGLHRSAGEGLSFDNSGFLVGQRRLEQSVKSVEENTHEILEFLKAQLKARELNPPEHQLSAFQRAIIEANRRTVIDTAAQVVRQSSSRTAALSRPTRDTDQPINNSQGGSGPVIRRRPIVDVNSPADMPARPASSTSDSSQNNTAQERTRDANGRFSGGQDSESTGSGSNWLDRVKNSIQSGVKDGLHADARGIDPTVDAINELGTLMSPVGKVANFTLRPLGALFRGRKRNEPIPRDEEKHNREQIRLLRRIAGGSNSGTGGLGAGMGKVVIGMITAVARRFPMIALALGIKTALDESDKNRPDEQGDVNPDGSSNDGVVGALNRWAGSVMNSVRGAGNAVNNALGGDDDYFDDGTKADSKNRPGLKTDAVNGGAGSNANTNRIAGGGASLDGKNLNVAVYNAYKKNGLSHEQALAMTAEVGRENDFNANVIFGKHTDLAKDGKGKSITNMGMLSWNRERAAALQEHLKKRGALDKNGNIIRSQAALDAQAEFSVNEMKSDKYKDKLNNFFANPNSDPETYAQEVGKNYVGWAYGQNSVKGSNGKRIPFDYKLHDTKRRKYLKQTSKDLNITSAQTDSTAYNRLNTNPAKPTQQAAVIPLMANSARSAPQLAPIQPIPAVKEPLSSKAPQIVQLASSSDNIGQNVADRDIAHGVTGGLGARTWDA